MQACLGKLESMPKDQNVRLPGVEPGAAGRNHSGCNGPNKHVRKATGHPRHTTRIAHGVNSPRSLGQRGSSVRLTTPQYLYYTAVRRCRAGTPLRRVGELWGLEGALTGACSTRDGCSGPNKHVGRVLVDSCHLERIAQHVGGPRGPPAGPPRRSAQRMLHLDCCVQGTLVPQLATTRLRFCDF